MLAHVADGDNGALKQPPNFRVLQPVDFIRGTNEFDNKVGCRAQGPTLTLSRPLGASFGDLMSQPTQYGGLGTIITSAIFLAAIVAIVFFMSIRHEGEELVEVDEDGKLAAASESEGFAVAEKEL